jgi:hypothetical protein
MRVAIDGVRLYMPGALARHVGEQVHAELVDQVEPHERPPEADAAPDDDMAVAATWLLDRTLSNADAFAGR